MGFFKKIFKGIGKVFKKVGKFIKKGFGKLGKFMNKLGIVGQIGMMFVSAGIANMAMAGLSALGSGFMPTLGALAGGKGLVSGAARFAHGVIQGTAQIASKGMNALGSITNNVVGAVTDTVKMIGSKVGIGQGVTAATGAQTVAGSQLSQMGANISARLANTKEAVSGLSTPFETLADTVTGKHSPNYQKFTDADGDLVNLDISVEDNLTKYQQSPQGKAALAKPLEAFKTGAGDPLDVNFESLQNAATVNKDIAKPSLDSLLSKPESPGLFEGPIVPQGDIITPTFESLPTEVPTPQSAWDKMTEAFTETYSSPQREKLLGDLAASKVTSGLGTRQTQYAVSGGGGSLVARSQTPLRAMESASIAGTDQPIGDMSGRFTSSNAGGQPVQFANDYDMFSNMFAQDFPTPNYFNANNQVGFQFS